MLTFAEAEKYLDSLLVFGIKLGLQNMESLLELLEHPEEDLDFIHLAGTNGKGSTACYLANALQGAGLKTGFYSSPFLVSFFERWRVDGENISEERFCEALSQVIACEEALIEKTGVKPTYFEVLTAVALLILKAEEVDVVVWETGMGGRLDATNVVKPLLSIITNVELDHTQYLGDTLAEVAAEKAGIIKEAVPTISCERKEEVREIIRKVCKEKSSSLKFVGDDFDLIDREVHKDGLGKVFQDISVRVREEEYKVSVKMLGSHQGENVLLAIASLVELRSLGLFSDLERALKGLEGALWPGRLQVLPDGAYVDGAHNPAGAKYLAESLAEIKPNEDWHLVAGILMDKDWKQVLENLKPVVGKWTFVPVQNVRTSQPEDLVDYVREEFSGEAEVKTLAEVFAADDLAKENRIFCGSLYLIGELLATYYPELGNKISH
mgnify:CR=1 FL=1